jgi:cytohesin
VLALCQLLLAAKADVALKNNAGHTPLHVACNSGQISIVQWLLTKEADHSDADKLGDTPLHVAARAGFKNIVSALLAAGAKQSANRAGKTPAQLAEKDIAALLEKSG